MRSFITRFSYLVLLGAMFGACSRPVAYYQHDQAFRYTSPKPSAPITTEQLDATPALASADESVSRANQAVDRLEAYVSTENKLATNKRLGKRIEHLKSLLKASAANKKLSVATAQQKTTGLEKLMLKKVNNKINKHLAPQDSKQAMVNGGLLGGSVVLLIVGVLLLLLASGTASAIGLILAIIGVIGFIFGILAS